MPDEMRPDRSRVLFSFESSVNPSTIYEKKYIVCRALDGVDTFDQSLVSATLDMLVAAETYPVWLSFNGTKKLVHPRSEVVRAIAAPYANHQPEVVAEARAWLNKYDAA